MRKKGKKLLSLILSMAMVICSISFVSMTSVSAVDTILVDDHFDVADYGAVGTKIKTNVAPWYWENMGSGMVIGQDPTDPTNTAAMWGPITDAGSYWQEARQSASFSTPIVLEGRIYMPEGCNSGLSLRINNYYLMSFSTSGALSANSKTLGYSIPGEWVKFKMAVLPNEDMTQSRITMYFDGNIGATAADAEAGNYIGKPVWTTTTKDLSASTYFGWVHQFKTGSADEIAAGAGLMMDDIKIYQVPTLDASLEKTTNITDSITMNFNHEINIDTATADSICVYEYDTAASATVGDMVEISGVEVTSDSVTAKLVNTLGAGKVYQVTFNGLEDLAGNNPSYIMYFSTDATQPPAPEKIIVPVSRITVNPSEIEVTSDFNKEITFGTKIMPTYADNQTLTWEIDDPGVATIDPVTGNVTPVGVGETKARAKSTDGSNVYSNDVTIKITPPRADDQKLTLGGERDDNSNKIEPRVDMEASLGWPSLYGDTQVALWYNNAKGAFSITIDDCISGDFDKWIEYKETYGIDATFFVPGTMASGSKASIQKLVDAGYDVQSHTTSHMSDTAQKNLKGAQQLYEYQGAIKMLKASNDVDVTTVGYSFGTADFGTYYDYDYVNQYYIAGRGVTGNMNRGDAIPYNYVSSKSMNGGVQVFYRNPTNNTVRFETMEGLIKSLYDTNYTYKNKSGIGGWACIHNHGLDSTGGATKNDVVSSNATTASVLEYCFENYLVPAMEAGYIWNGSFTDIAKYGQERDTAEITVKSIETGKIVFDITDEMDDTIFTHPLTVKIKVESDWSNLYAAQGGKVIDAKLVENNGSLYALVNAVPDAGEVTVSADSDIPVAQPISALSVTANGSTEQKVGYTTDVVFSAATTPGENVDASSVKWYLNGEDTGVSGLTYTLAAKSKAGIYKVKAVASNRTDTVSSNEVTVTVASLSGDTEFVMDSFSLDEYGTLGTKVADGGLWDTADVNITVETDLDDNTNTAARLYYNQAAASGNYAVNLKKEIKTNNEYFDYSEPIVFSGRVYLTQNKSESKINDNLYININGSEAIRFWKNSREIRCNNSRVGYYAFNDWIDFRVVIEPNEDLTQCKYTWYINGAIGSSLANANAGTYTSATYTVTKDLSTVTDAKKVFSFAYNVARTDPAAIYVDDMQIYTSSSLKFDAQPLTANTFALDFSHDIKTETLSASAISVYEYDDASGSTVGNALTVSGVDIVGGKKAVVTLASNAQAGKKYQVSLATSVVDYTANSVENVAYFIVAGGEDDSDDEEDEVVYGDVDGNGSVNSLDRAVFSRYLAKWEKYLNLANPDGADANGDGNVNSLDRAVMSRHLAKWSGYESLPHVK